MNSGKPFSKRNPRGKAGTVRPKRGQYRFDLILGMADDQTVNRMILEWDGKPLHILVSYMSHKKWPPFLEEANNLGVVETVMLDSGAYTADYKPGAKLEMSSYVSFCRDYRHMFDRIVGLDVSGDAKTTYKNCQEMRDQLGFPVMPVYHIGEDIKWLDKYVDEMSEHGVGISSSKIRNKRKRLKMLRECGERYPEGVAFHSFGWVVEDALLAVPLASADSSSAITSGARWGRWQWTKYGTLSLHHHKSAPMLLRAVEGAMNVEAKVNAKWRRHFKCHLKGKDASSKS